MTALDPEDPRPPYRQMADALRAAILTRKFKPGDKLPSQAELVERYGVARMTVQQALRVLANEGLTVSRAGSGVFVRERTERPVGLRPHVEAAFERPNVTVDFSGYTAETLHGVLQEPLDMIRLGRLTPESISVRMLLSDMTAPIAIPSRAGDKPGDDPAVRGRMEKIARRHTTAIIDGVQELAEFGLVQKVNVAARVHSSAPLFKLYVLNDQEVFFGFYPVIEHDVTIAGKTVPIFDPMGKDATLFHHTLDEDETSTNSLYVAEARKWFDSVWNTIAREFIP
jgi:DNA-binding transcriptional regulator YhcF (GntR family)